FLAAFVGYGAFGRVRGAASPLRFACGALNAGTGERAVGALETFGRRRGARSCLRGNRWCPPFRRFFLSGPTGATVPHRRSLCCLERGDRCRGFGDLPPSPRLRRTGRSEAWLGQRPAIA